MDERLIMKVDDPVIFRQKIKQQFNKFLDDEMRATNLEKGIYNNSINLAKKLKIVRKWDSKYFVLLYINQVKSILVNINPDAPTRAPDIISPLFIKTNPVAAAATPEYELSREITTGMSAPPIGMVRVMPINADKIMSP